MIYVNEKNAEGNLGAKAPQQVVDELDAVAVRLGLVKKRAIAAAVWSFTRAGREQQRAIYDQFHEVFFPDAADATPAGTEGPGFEEILDEELVRADAEKLAKKRRGPRRA